MNVLIVQCHPRKDSLCAALAAAYGEGAVEAGVAVRHLTLADMVFDLSVRTVSPQAQESEPDVRRAREWIRWADHLVFVYPTWWGTMPALLKGFLDRVLTPGFAFAEREGGGWEPLLTEKSAHLLTTMDTPPWVYRRIIGQPGHNALKRATLGFCGVRPIRVHAFGPVKDSSRERRARWLEQARREGAKLRGGVRTAGERIGNRTLAWVRALRLQFYPMTWIAYTAGAFGAGARPFASVSYWLGYLTIFLIEVATVLANERFDFDSDRRNRFYGPFSGGSRVLVDGSLTFPAIRAGIAVALVLAALAGGLLVHSLPPMAAGGALALLLAGFTLGLGYTTPPLRLAYRGFGELTVALTHSFLVILCGYVFGGGSGKDAFPYLLGLPLFFSVLPSILLAGIPDREADRDAAKRTIAVRLGARGAAFAAMGFTVLAAVAALVWQSLGLARGAFGGAIYFVVPHAALLIALIRRYRRRQNPPRRIDGILVAALSYILWFCVLPLIHLG